MKFDTFAFEVWFVEFTVRYLWGGMRKVVGHHLSRRCKVCVLSENFTPLNEQGVCRYCEEHRSQPRTPHEERRATFAEQLGAVLEESQGAGTGQYDAIVLFSGGKDSSFMLHKLLTDYPGLRIVTLLVDNDLLSPYAVENAKRALAKFDVAHWTVRLTPSFAKKVFRHTLLSLEKQTGYSLVDKMDAYLTFDTARNLAASGGIPLVVCGLSRVQTQNIFGLTDVFEFPRGEERGPLQDRCDLGWSEVLTEDEMKFWWDGSQWPEERVPHFLLPYCAWDFEEEYILDEVDRLGLIERKKSRPLTTNNKLIPVIGMAEVARFGYSSFEVEFAQMVREGKSDRHYWLSIFEMLEYSTKTGRFINKSVEETLRYLSLDKRDIGIAG